MWSLAFLLLVYNIPTKTKPIEFYISKIMVIYLY